ncbi:MULTISPECIES: hypothetical protein [unclassified Pseudoalteromonas]|jgi:hypothetical protein|uniref:hypothetical protein n=1 Tax=unclassified Pseudoalteromonas TaxID=194690 RepID=UPI0009754B26|nr:MULTISPECIES: hypothetical protein [unclassified Pseudoalteromonas]QBJ63008.1 hypothetical protein B1F84_08130 [Pseudoalteromonas sp. DL-6]
MRFVIFVGLALLSCSVFANPLLGTWEFVQGKYAVENGFVTAKAPEITSVKLVTASHFSYITEKNGQFSYAGGGQYKLTDGQFIETFKYGNIASLMGKTMAFDYKVAGNLWHHSLTENGQLVEAEVWRKIK